MFENRSALELTVGRSTVRQSILALLMAEPGSRLHLREIQRRAATSPGTASRELAKLVGAGLIEREAEGHQVYFRASASPFATMLRSILVAMPAPEAPSRPRRLPRAPRAAAAGDAPIGSDPGPRPATEGGAPAGDTVDVETHAEAAEPAAEVEAAAAPPRIIESLARPRVAAPGDVTESVAVAVTSHSRTPDPLGLQIARRLAAEIRPMYGDTLVGVYLYGLRAAGPAPADADVETIVVLNRVDHYGAELEKTSHACAALAHDYGVFVSRVFVAEDAWKGGPGDFGPAVRIEAIAV